ncbi:hypothetical protein RI129_005529 [Pyrocoelia pectoralis]|uniref:DUF4371 domain-containing protein n=1 Tax=Pyrocoelia pectoralis TaxID=417401 RepID=A0AAN7VED0_9COLE
MSSKNHTHNGQVLSEIILELKEAKYYSISGDSTPDISHYMKEYSSVERFLDFIPMERHGAAYLFDTVLSFFKEKGISLEDCRGKTYDNAPNMPGLYNGLQAKLKEHCTCTLFVPCLAHSLNHVVGETAGCVMEATYCFLFLKKLYTFFASFTRR